MAFFVWQISVAKPQAGAWKLATNFNFMASASCIWIGNRAMPYSNESRRSISKRSDIMPHTCRLSARFLQHFMCLVLFIAVAAAAAAAIWFFDPSPWWRIHATAVCAYARVLLPHSLLLNRNTREVNNITHLNFNSLQSCTRSHSRCLWAAPHTLAYPHNTSLSSIVIVYVDTAHASDSFVHSYIELCVNEGRMRVNASM